jgi:pre-mRNA-splicing helicase BRR2
MIEPTPPQYFIKVISDKWISSETQLPISFKHLILPEKFPPHSNLLDLQPLHFSALKWKQAEKLYSNYPCLNPFQTQVFKSIYETDESVFIGVPTGMGKTLCAEFALLRFIKDNQFRAPAIYVTSIEALAKEKFREWNEKFSEALNIKIGYLTGQLSLDTKIFEKSQIIVCTPDKIDMLTRRWRQRKNVQAISLVIIDEIHLLGESGSVLEVVVSRLRYMSHQLSKHIRFIALSTSLANAKDLADWLGVSQNNTFNFDTNVRPIQLEIHIQGFEHIQRKMRLLAMSKSIYTSIKTHANNKKPVMIYTSDRKQARITALDLLTNTAADDEPNRFLIADVKDIENFLDGIEETTLKHCLRYGVGYIHDGLNRYEKTIVQQLFSEGAIQVLVVTHNVCWEVNLFCHLVVIVDPMKYDGKDHR